MIYSLTEAQKELPYKLTNLLSDVGLLDDETEAKFYNEMAELIANVSEEFPEYPWDEGQPERPEVDYDEVIDYLFASSYFEIEHEGKPLSKVVEGFDDKKLIEFQEVVEPFTELMVFETGRCGTIYEGLAAHALKLNRAVAKELACRFSQQMEG